MAGAEQFTPSGSWDVSCIPRLNSSGPVPEWPVLRVGAEVFVFPWDKTAVPHQAGAEMLGLGRVPRVGRRARDRGRWELQFHCWEAGTCC